MTNNEIVKSQEGLVEVFNFSQEKTPIYPCQDGEQRALVCCQGCV